MLSKQCKLHLEQEGMTGLQHMRRALKMAVKLQLAVPALVVHSVAPRFFTRTASTIMKDCLGEKNDR